MRSNDALFPESCIVNNDSQLLIEVNKDYANEIMNMLNETFLPSSFLTCSALATLDNCLNVHAIREKSFFVGALRKCSTSDVVSAVTGRNSPQGIGTATMCWRHACETVL